MRIHPDVKMLAVVVVLFLAVGVSDGMILSKCELKQQLERDLTLQIPNSADVLAQSESYLHPSFRYRSLLLCRFIELILVK